MDTPNTSSSEKKQQFISPREAELIQQLARLRQEQKQELEYETFDGYQLPPRTQFSMLKKPAVSIKYGQMNSNMACIRLFEGLPHILTPLHPGKKRLTIIPLAEEESASVDWARLKDGEWVNRGVTTVEFTDSIFSLMNWNHECRYKALGRIANSERGLVLIFDLEEAIMFTPDMHEYVDPSTGEIKHRQIKYFPDTYKDCIGKSYNDYAAARQINLFEDFAGYQGEYVPKVEEPEVVESVVVQPSQEGGGSYGF